MPRAALFTLLVVSILAGSVQAQRAGATFQGNAAGAPGRSGFAGQRGFSNRFFPRRGSFSNRFHVHHDNVGSILVPYPYLYDEPFGDEQPYAEATTKEPVPPVVILQSDDRQSRTPEPPPRPQVIEIPAVANAAAKMLPPTIFILANGERLETRRFLLTASNLSVRIDRQQRTVPLDMLDINATLDANHDRGIDLRIPADRNEISVSF